MKADYLKFVQWSEEDQLFVGYCPDLFIGGVCHGADEQRVYRELSRLVAEEITESRRAKRPLPRKSALVTIPVAVWRRATKGKADVLLLTPARALSRWSEMAELGEATRRAAQERKAGLVDLEKAFEAVPTSNRAQLFVEDKVHLSPAGQELVANAVHQALAEGAR